MLYITTRDIHDAHTAHKTLIGDFAADCGPYMPYRLPIFDKSEIEKLQEATFGKTVADILNIFYSAQLTGWDIEFCVGRNPLKAVQLSRKVTVIQTWHNPSATFSYALTQLYNRLCPEQDRCDKPTNWFTIAVQIAFLFASYGELLHNGSIHRQDSFNLAINTGDFSGPIAAWYARKMGLPIERIICSCEQNSAVWDLVHRGEIATAGLSESLRSGLERLIYEFFGMDEAVKYISAAQKRGTYTVPEACDQNLSDVFFCAVIGTSRIPTVINSVYRTDKYLFDAAAATPYGAIQDYRAKTGENRFTLMLEEISPVHSSDTIMRATGMTKDAFYSLCKNI